MNIASMPRTSRFHGIFTPLITPITEAERPDLKSLERLVRFQLDAGVHGLWVMGTTAEFASFSADDRAAAVETSVYAASGAVPVIANVSAASTRESIQHGQRARSAGAEAIAATPPFYYPHSQDELLTHYRAIRAAVDLPLYIYNIPQTVRVRIELATAEALISDGTVAGIKDSQNDLEWFRQLTLFTRLNGLPFVAFAGTRYLIDAAILAGASGAIPSLANAFPELCVAVFNAVNSGDLAGGVDAEARIIQIESATRLLAQGSRNAATLGLLKAILHDRGLIERPDLTAPLRTPSDVERAALLGHIESIQFADAHI